MPTIHHHSTREEVLEAVKQNGYALQFAPDDLKADSRN